MRGLLIQGLNFSQILRHSAVLKILQVGQRLAGPGQLRLSGLPAPRRNGLTSPGP